MPTRDSIAVIAVPAKGTDLAILLPAAATFSKI